ncbi:MAG: glutamine--fructose-6-phosphate transaminase (isomerizing) [Chloroflexota bacterium]
MCGIFGYVGRETNVGSLVLDALRQLEYRGYDSWGVGVGVNGHVAIQKDVGKIGESCVDLPSSAIGFGHTRWATHGGVVRINAHPHAAPGGRFAVIHNGIIENFRELKSALMADGYEFVSETDTEVVVHLVSRELHGAATPESVVDAVRAAFNELDGLNAIIVLDRATETLTAAKNVSPLVVGRSNGAYFIASDQIALAGKAEEIAFLEDGDIVQLSRAGLTWIRNGSGAHVERGWRAPSVAEGSVGLDGYPHYLLKEIHEQPDVIRRIAREGLNSARELAREIQDSYGTFLLGCGTASYAALSGSYLFSRIARRHVNFILGSEFAYQEHFLTERSLVAALSQSGETADIIQSILAAKKRKSRIAALVNVEGSTLDRLADVSIHLKAGPELCVLSTKAYSAKVALLLLTAYIVAGDEQRGVQILEQAADAVEAVLQPHSVDLIRAVAESIAEKTSMFAIGRGLSYPTALEAALKIKEVSYIHAEGFAGGELKHGVIALIEQGTPCLVFAPNDETRSDILSGAMEVKSRGGYIIGFGPDFDPTFDVHIPTLDVGDGSALSMVVPAQLIGYELARIRGYDPDKPRNLAKSVTVK